MRNVLRIRFVQDGQPKPNYEKTTLHFSQCRAPRSLRAKIRNRQSAGGQKHHRSESRFDCGREGEDQGNHEHQYDDHGNDASELVDFDQHDYDDLEPQSLGCNASIYERLPAVILREAFLLYSCSYR